MARKLFVEFDLAGAEWVIVAFIAQDPAMISVFRSGMSPHVATANFMYDVPIETIEHEEKLLEGEIDPERIKAVRKEHHPELFKPGAKLPAAKTLRQTAKACNHALNYGLGYKQFAMRLEIPEAEAKIMRTLYHDKAYPGVSRTFWKYVQSEIKTTGSLTNCFGRRRDFYEEPGPTLWLDAYAHLPQSTVADIIRLGMVHIYHHERGAELMAQDHDSVTAQVRNDPEYVADFVGRMQEVLGVALEYGGETFSLGVDAKAGFTRNKRRMVKVTNDAAQCRASLEKLQLSV